MGVLTGVTTIEVSSISLGWETVGVNSSNGAVGVVALAGSGSVSENPIGSSRYLFANRSVRKKGESALNNPFK